MIVVECCFGAVTFSGLVPSDFMQLPDSVLVLLDPLFIPPPTKTLPSLCSYLYFLIVFILGFCGEFYLKSYS